MILDLDERDDAAYAKRGLTHDLEYYDGPLMAAQMCVAHDGMHVVEVVVDNRVAETDGHSVYFRLSKRDLEAMLRILDEEPVDNPGYCGQSPCGARGPCLSCSPLPVYPNEERDE